MTFGQPPGVPVPLEPRGPRVGGRSAQHAPGDHPLLLGRVAGVAVGGQPSRHRQPVGWHPAQRRLQAVLGSARLASTPSVTRAGEVPEAGVSDKTGPRKHGRVPPEWREEIRDCFAVSAPKVRGFLRFFTRGDQELAAGLVQDTFKEATENWCELRDRSSDGREAWLLQVARYLAVDAFRRAATERRKLPQAGIRHQPAEADVHTEAMTGVAMEIFIKVTNEMPPQRALVATLYWRCGWSNGEIAEELGITRGAVSQHLAKARATLKSELSPYVPFDLADPEGGENA